MKQRAFEIVRVIFVLAMMSVPCQTVVATNAMDVQYPVMPTMTYIVDCTIDFGINDSVAEVETKVTGNGVNTTRAKVIAELQAKSGSN